MNVVCPKCNEKLAEIQSVAHLNLSVHCPFDGEDFGVTVEPSAPAEVAPSATPGPAPVTG